MSHPMTLDEVLKRGLAYRKLALWSRQGWLRTVPGPGGAYVWLERELLIADLMRRLTAAGLGVEASASAARRLVEEGRLLVSIGPGIVLAVDTDLLREET